MNKSLNYSSYFDENILMNLKYKTPFFVFNSKAVLDNYNTYKLHMPANTEICYSMKSNSEKPLLETLNNIGSSFEVSSKYELALLKTFMVPPEKIIYGASIKEASHIKEFVKYGVNRFAFDCKSELLKIKKYAPHAEVYVRANVKIDSASIFHMSEKFGATPEDAYELLREAKNLGLTPYGISFNVGSMARNVDSWANGIVGVASIMDKLLQKGIKIKVINMGGGFPNNYTESDRLPTTEQIGKSIKIALQSVPYKVDYIIEPGRGISVNGFALITSIIEKNERPNGHWLYTDAGVYNALLEAMSYQGSTRYHIVPLKKNPTLTKKIFIIAGPTCDDLDVIDQGISLPENMKSGDRLLINDAGAYTFTLSTRFNGFPKPRVITLKS